MTPAKKDPTEAMRLRASRYREVDEGTACTQSSFKTGGKAFLFVGMQGGRYKAMFKLAPSMAEAARLAKKSPGDYDVGTGGWVTARFTAEEPMPKKLWEKWLDESYALSRGKAAGKKKAGKASAKKASARKSSKKGAARKSPARKQSGAKRR